MVEPTHLEKCARQIRKSSPRIGMKIKNIGNHHLVSVLNWSFLTFEGGSESSVFARPAPGPWRKECAPMHLVDVGLNPPWNEAGEVKKNPENRPRAPKGNESSSNHPMLVSGSVYIWNKLLFVKMLRGISPYNSAVVEWLLLMIFRTLGNYPPENSRREHKNVRFGEWFSSSKTWFSASTLIFGGCKPKPSASSIFVSQGWLILGLRFPVHPNSSNAHVHTTPVFPGQKWHRKFWGPSQSLSGPWNHWNVLPNDWVIFQVPANPGSHSVRLPRFFCSQRLRHWFFFRRGLFHQRFQGSILPAGPPSRSLFQWSW